jgi:hypothetical protein
MAGGGAMSIRSRHPHGQQYVSLLVKPAGRCWLRCKKDDAQ